MTLGLKQGVRLQGLRPEMTVGATIVHSVYADFGLACTITAGIDGGHSRASLHYAGCALDFRTNNVKTEQLKPLQAAIAAALGGDFDVVLEADHLHVEYQPKVGY